MPLDVRKASCTTRNKASSKSAAIRPNPREISNFTAIPLRLEEPCTAMANGIFQPALFEHR
jgi:hypothetical protein